MIDELHQLEDVGGEMSRRARDAGVIVTAAVLLTAPSVNGAEGGYTNYVPGLYGDFGVAVAPDPGFYLRNDLYYYTADVKRSVKFGEIRTDLELETAMYMLTGLKVLDREILGGRYAFGAFLPVVYADLSSEITLGPLTSYRCFEFGVKCDLKCDGWLRHDLPLESETQRGLKPNPSRRQKDPGWA